jgi:hypothetical protein
MPVHGSIIPQHLIPLYEQEAGQKQVVYKDIEKYLDDIDDEERWTRFKTFSTFFTFLSAAAGAFVILLATASTDAFQSQPKLLGLLVFGALLEAPVLWWAKVMFCPSKEEKHRRKMIRLKRKARLEALDENKKREEIELVHIKQDKDDEEMMKNVIVVKGKK